MKRWGILLGVVLTMACSPAFATIEYTVSFAQPESHLFHVVVTVPHVDGNVDLQLPAWNALYQVRDFAARLQRVRAEDEQGHALPLLKMDKLTWRTSGRGMVRVLYDTYWDDGGPFNAQLNGDHAFINFAMILMYVPARRAEEVRVQLADVPSAWKVAVALAAGSTPNSFTAASYDALVDAPLEAGTFEEARFEVNGARVKVIVHASSWQHEQLLDALQRIVAYQTKLMREVPFPQFTFIFHLGAGGGGMEHSNSTAISSGAGSGRTEAVAAHEFFHLWNVKRIRPQSLEPVDFTKENWTRALWFAEGVTSTYGSYTMVRTRLWTPQQYYEDLAGEFMQLQARPAHQWKSVEEASLDAWFEKYPQYNRPQFSISYYNKGQILGVLLDILIRDATDNKKSLDDVLRDLNETYAHKGLFYPDSRAIQESAEKVAGRKFAEFFENYVSGTTELPYADILRRAGLLVTASGGDRVRYEIEEDPGATAKAKRIRESLLKGANE
jgi:predicted metalloprotease with PDZ domain